MKPQSTVARTALAGAALVFAIAAGAAVVYRWVDETGRTNVSDTVPEKYRKSATRVDTREAEVSPESRKLAEERAAREKVFVDGAARKREAEQAAERTAAASAAQAAAAAASAAAGAKRPAQVPTEATDCDTWWRLYLESEECFGPYRTAPRPGFSRGGIRAEAFEKCNEVTRPDLKCGPQRR